MKENMMTIEMRDNYRYFGGLSFLYGLIFTFCLYKNISGITFPVCVGVTIAFAILFLKKVQYKIKKNSIPYLIGMELLGLSSAFTTSPFMHLFNIIGILLLFIIFMIHHFYDDDDHTWNFTAYLKRMMILIGTLVASIPYPYRHGGWHFNKNKSVQKNKTLIAVVIGVIVAMGILFVTLPLLLMSDMIFATIFVNILDNINFGNFGNSIGISLTFIVGFTLPYAFFTALCQYNFPEEKESRKPHLNPVTGITFTSIVSVIYLVYCAIQVIYLFMGRKAGLPENVTYAEYAREGFWELLFVSVINFIMVLLCIYLFRENRMLKMILTIVCGCTFIMIISSAYRMMMYVGEYKLTFLRILVLWFLAVLALIMLGVVVSIYRKQFPLFHYIVAVVGVLYIGFSFSRPDVIAAKYDIARWENSADEDFSYLMFDAASIDAAPLIAEIDLEDERWDSVDKESIRKFMYNYFLNISENNEDIYFRKANYSRIRAKQAADRYLEVHREYDGEIWQ